MKVLRRIESMVCKLSPRRANLLQCGRKGGFDPYFVEAEHSIEQQWNEIIFPMIREFDFSTVLELAPGAGRNTERLATLAEKIYAVDLNAYALEHCRTRLGETHEGCTIEYVQNNGVDLGAIPSDAITTIYCWDSAVHFEKSILCDYFAEFARVLAPGGRGFVHHSNLGDAAHENMKLNPGCRSNADAAAVADACAKHGLEIVEQRLIPWSAIEDCITVFSKP